MALTFPLATTVFADLLEYSSFDMNLMRSEEMGGLGSGEYVTMKLAPDLWEVKARSILLTEEPAMKIGALLDALGTSNEFYLYHVMRRYPRLDPTGSIYGSATPLVNSISAARDLISIKSLPANYALSPGDLFQITYSSTRRALLKVVEAVTANGSGTTAQFAVTPAVPSGVLANSVVSFIKPSAKMKLLPESFGTAIVGTINYEIYFSARQVLNA